MARKKTRPAPAAASTAVTAAPPPPPAAVHVPAPKPKTSKTGPERSFVELVAVRIARLAGSLQVAVVGLSIFAASVLLGTLMEHWYNTKIAQDLVYKSWWFILLLAVLSCNIFFAAAKKWPWKKHQTGFVITHIGLLLMLFGGILNAWKGVDASMQLIDTTDQALLSASLDRFGFTNIGDRLIYRDTSIISIKETDGRADAIHGRPMGGGPSTLKSIEEPFDPGPLPWNPDDNVAARTDLKLALLTWLASPLGKSWSMRIDNNVWMEVFDYLPFARYDQYSASDKSRGFPALKVEFDSPQFPAVDGWMALLPFNQYAFLREFNGGEGSMPGRIELIGHCPGPLVKEFLDPPPAGKLGANGTLVVVVGGTPVRIDVEANMSKSVTVAKDVKVRVLKYTPDWTDPKTSQPSDPAVDFEVSTGNAKVVHRAFARKTGSLMTIADKQETEDDQRAGDPYLVWYHPPDFRRGNDKLFGLLQFVVADRGQLYYRSFTNKDKEFTVESAGPSVAGADFSPFWKKMNGRFRVVEFLPSADLKERYYAANVTPGKETPKQQVQFRAAIHCRITDGKNSKEFWLRHGSRKPVQFGNRTFQVSLGDRQQMLGFQIKLERAEQTVDPGTRAAASYTSWVQIFDPQRDINGKREMITMNEPLEYRGFKFYQSSYDDMDGLVDGNRKPVSMSGFTVGYDPGLSIKYLGSICLAAGIFMMFYMKAYFFKGPARPARTEPVGNA